MEQIGSELEGLEVLDFCAFVAGAICTRRLARWGAEVIKSESLGADHLRGMRPLRAGESAYFSALNTGKRSVSLNLCELEGRDAALELLGRAGDDVTDLTYGDAELASRLARAAASRGGTPA